MLSHQIENDSYGVIGVRQRRLIAWLGARPVPTAGQTTRGLATNQRRAQEGSQLYLLWEDVASNQCTLVAIIAEDQTHVQ